MTAITVSTTSYVDIPDDTDDPNAIAEATVKDALESNPTIFLVKVVRTDVLVEH